MAGSFVLLELLIILIFLLDARIEEFVYEKLDRKAPSRINNPELLGQYMIDAGTEFGPGTAYGKWKKQKVMINIFCV